jgi:carbamoyltransferase
MRPPENGVSSLADALFELGQPRRKGAPFTQKDKDIACALQESLEEIAFHVISHYQSQTGHKSLCLAGGVAHNCTLNGKILRSGMFDRVFVQPAAHDAGAALGAAFYAHFKLNPVAPKPVTLQHVYLGSKIAAARALLEELDKWSLLITTEKLHDTAKRAAELLATGAVVGWVQGCSEFGPRALGNRSILADARPAENKDRINQMVKKREGYRPFAPSVIEEDAGEFFELPAGTNRFPYMIFLVRVKEEKRSLLGAVTHVDGTARIQTVGRSTNELFWQLLRAFQNITGVPVLLNTSFNNYAEPIVDSVEDALRCYLTTGLDCLIVGDYLIRKREVPLTAYLSLKVSLPVYVHLQQLLKPCFGSDTRKHYLRTNYNADFKQDVSPAAFDLLARTDGRKTIGQLLNEEKLDDGQLQLVLEELIGLWEPRLIQLNP